MKTNCKYALLVPTSMGLRLCPDAGQPVAAGGEGLSAKVDGFKGMIQCVAERFPRVEVFATTLHEVVDTNTHNWGIRCNAIAPGFFLTDQNRFLLTDEATGALKPRGKKIIANTPVHRFGEPEEIVGTMLYLLSDISAFVTGVIIPVDGGYSAFGGV